MASAYVIWERSSRTFVGGPTPVTFTSSADATAHAVEQASLSAQAVRVPVPVFDVVTVTV